MKRIFTIFLSILFFININSYASETLKIDKQLVGIVGAISGTVKTETRELKIGDKIYLNESIISGAESGTQILLLDQSTFTVGEDSEVVMDTFIYDPETNDGKIVASVKQGSLKVISGLISKKNPDSLTVEVPEGTLGSRGTEFQTMVSTGKTDTLLIGPGKNNTLGMRPGVVLVGNSFGQTLLDNPYSIASMTKGKAPGQAKKITKNQLKKFNKKMKALKVAKLNSGESKEKRKALKKELKKFMGYDVNINVSEIKRPGLRAELVGQNIAQQLEKKVNYRRAVKKAIQSTMSMGAEGIRVCVSGRLNGNEIARSETYREGRVPLHTLRAQIDYTITESHTSYGIIGVKVWIYTGEKRN